MSLSRMPEDRKRTPADIALISLRAACEDKVEAQQRFAFHTAEMHEANRQRDEASRRVERATEFLHHALICTDPGCEQCGRLSATWDREMEAAHDAL